MKIFAVTAPIKLINNPTWFDAFRAKYDEPYEHHITLKQPCYVEDTEVQIIKNNLESYFKTMPIPAHSIKLNFDVLFPDVEDPSNAYIMIKAKPDEQVTKLQRDIVACLADYNNYRRPELKMYEENFVPHITIGRHLDQTRYQEALAELPQSYSLTGEVNSITLVAVNNHNAEESNDPNNQTIYKL